MLVQRITFGLVLLFVCDGVVGRYYHSNQNHVGYSSSSYSSSSSSVTCAVGVTYSYIADPDDDCRFFICENGVLVGGDSWQCPTKPSFLSYVLTKGINQPCSKCQNSAATSTKATPATVTYSTADVTPYYPNHYPNHYGSTYTPQPATPPKALVSVDANSYKPGGVLKSGITTISDCIVMCQQDPTCFGFNFVTSNTTCYFHTLSTICNNLIPSVGTTHFSFYNCSVDVTPATVQTFLGMHISGGTLMPAYRDVDSCIMACQSTTGCLGIDFNSRYNSCWFHYELTECNTLISKAHCTHYRFIDCDVTTAATGTTQTSTGFHIFGGALMAAYRDLQSCLDACLATPSTCMAIDFNSQYNTCWFHSSATACNPLEPKASCTNYRFIDCGIITTAPPSQTPLPPTSPIPAGFVSADTNFHIPGGQLVAAGVTESQCLDLCLMQSFCLAVDYNTVDRTCFFHNTETYCDALVAMNNINNYRRVSCVTSVPNKAVEVRLMFHVLGGTLLCSGSSCTIESCLAVCYQSTTCQGIDFDSRDNSCFMHTAATVCNPLVPKSYCQHITTVACTTIPGPTGPYVPPTGTFIEINFPGPTTLPSGWLAYPGMNIDGGDLLGSGVNGDDCVTLCQADPTCRAVDFNSGDGTCWRHTDATKCGMLNPNNAVYHVSLPPQCASHPAPLGVAP